MKIIGVVSNNIEMINRLIKNYKDIVIITNENAKKYLNCEIQVLVIEEKLVKDKYLEKLCEKSNYVILQDNINLSINLKKDTNIITYGFNHKSTVTVSSNDEEKLSICIQRTIKKLDNTAIEPQELIIKKEDENNINEKIIEKIIQEILEK